MHTIAGVLDQTIVLIGQRSEQRASGHRLRLANTVVIINEFGEVWLDHLLVRARSLKTSSR